MANFMIIVNFTSKQKVNGWKKIYQNKVDFRAKRFTRDREIHYILIKEKPERRYQT